MPGQEPADKIIAVDSTMTFKFKGARMALAEGAEKMAISVAGKALAYSESAYSVVLSKRETLTLKRSNEQIKPLPKTQKAESEALFGRVR